MSAVRQQLDLKALAALCEIADTCGKDPAPKSLSLRFLLAYTFVAAGAEPKWKWLWNSFWENATAIHNPDRSMDDYLRCSGAQTALNGICRQMGYSTSPSFFEMLRCHRRAPSLAEEPAENGGPTDGANQDRRDRR